MEPIIIAEICISLGLIISILSGTLPSKYAISVNHNKKNPILFWLFIIGYIIILGGLIEKTHFEFDKPHYIQHGFKINGEIILKGINEETKTIHSAQIISKNQTICNNIDEIKKLSNNRIKITFNNCTLDKQTYYYLNGEISDYLYLKSDQPKKLKIARLNFPK